MKLNNKISKIILTTILLTSIGTISSNITLNANELVKSGRCIDTEEEYIVTTKTSPLNLRVGPNTKSKVITKIPTNSVITKISDFNNEWAKTVYTTPQGKEFIGYAFYGSGYTQKANFESFNYGTITSNRVIFRNEGNKNSKKCGYFYKGDRVYVLGNPNKNGYYKVWVLESNNSIKTNYGYVHKDYFKSEE